MRLLNKSVFDSLFSLWLREEGKEGGRKTDRPGTRRSSQHHRSPVTGHPWNQHDSPHFSFINCPFDVLEGRCRWTGPNGYMFAFGMWIIGAPCVGWVE
jgi:hypothetical protein